MNIENFLTNLPKFNEFLEKRITEKLIAQNIGYGINNQLKQIRYDPNPISIIWVKVEHKNITHSEFDYLITKKEILMTDEEWKKYLKALREMIHV